MLIYFAIMMAYSASAFSMNEDGTPWKVLRKEDKVVQEQNKEAANEMAELFSLMNPKSRLRKTCLDEASDPKKINYHCKRIADILYCAQRDKTRAHQAYCNNSNISHFDSSHNETYHTSKLAEDHHLTPQQTTREIEWFIETVKNLSQGKK